ncbi:MAG TPA: protein kinase, partial [Candidatus Polarisedimenticolia bacterium]|nr:protein kinase [Candidatus Polarisedimenticolia bacterium]
MNLSPGQTLSHYRLVGEIGRGGMGVVYEAVDTSLDRRVALKILPAEATSEPERLERFRREAKAVAALNHPNIVTIYSVEEAEGIHFLTMELVAGKTLHELTPEGGLPLERIFQIAIPLAEALSVAHERGIVHRDLKPSNIVVSEDGRVKVLDFGLAKLMASAAEVPGGSLPPTRTLGTVEGKILGTVPYMSPEQVSGKAVDHRSDIFSLGIILYEMALGKRPFSGESSAELASSILRDLPTSVTELRSDLPSHLGWVIRRCLEKDPRRRYQSALDISNELADLKSGLSSESPAFRSPTSAPGISSPAGGIASSAQSGAARSAAGSGALQPVSSGPGQGAISGGRETFASAAGKAPVPVRYLVFAGFLAVAGMIFTAVYLRRDEKIPSPPAPGEVPASGPGVPVPAAAKGPSIAILPFVNMSSDPDNEYFSDGMTEELINALAKVQGLKVPARTTVFALKGKSLGIEEIGKKLGVGTVLEGSVRKAGDRLRINVQLVGTSDGSALWSEEYDREFKDVFAIQDEISRKIVESLKVKLTPTEQHAIERVPTRDAKAYDFYLRGRRNFYRGGAKNNKSAEEMFWRAVHLDSKYALAYAGLADVASFKYMYSESTPEVLEAANGASKKALELAPDLAESHASRGLALSLSKDYSAAAREFETAIRLDPRLFEAYYFYARNCFAQGLREQAAHLFEQAMKVRPEDYQSPALLATVYLGLGRKEDAARMWRKTIELAEAQLEANPDDARALYLAAGCLIAEGQLEKAMEWARRAVALDPTDTGTLYNVACVYAGAGKKDEAMGYLEKAVDNG